MDIPGSALVVVGLDTGLEWAASVVEVDVVRIVVGRSDALLADSHTTMRLKTRTDLPTTPLTSDLIIPDMICTLANMQ